MPTPDHVASILRRVADALTADGRVMLQRADDWQAGPRAANLDPDARGWRYEVCGDTECRSCPHPVPADPTGEATTRLDRAALIASQLDRLLRDLDRAAGRLVTLHGVLMPEQPRQARTLKEINAAGADVAAEGWCRSCWRDEQTCAPVETKPDGSWWYRDLCRWCGAFNAEHGQYPPLSLLQKRHRGYRISQADIDRALGRRAKAG